MKLTLPRDTLAAALARVGRVVEKRNTIPVLSHIRAQARKRTAGPGGMLVLTATDLDLEITTTIEAEAIKIGAEGEVMLPAALTEAFVKKLPAGSDLALEADAGAATLKSGRTRARLLTLDAVDFPDFSGAAATHTFALPASALASVFDRLRFAISTEETRYYLCGIYMHLRAGPDGPALAFVATDGHRLALHTMLAPPGTEGLPPVIVPRKAVDEMGRLLAGMGEEAVTLAVSPTTVRLTAGATVLASKLIDGTYPDYERVIPQPQAGDPVALLAGAELAAAVDRMVTVSSERGRAVKFAFAAGAVTLSATNAGTGEASDEVAASYEGAPLEIGFNGAYVLEVLGALPGPRARIALRDAGSPARICAEGDDGCLFVLMPMRV